MKYRVGEVQSMTDGRDFHSGFNILNSPGVPIVTCSYLDGADAAKARALIEQRDRRGAWNGGSSRTARPSCGKAGKGRVFTQVRSSSGECRLRWLIKVDE